MNADNRPPISFAVISSHEETRIGKCLESVRGLVREMIVVDSGSTDHTVAIAEEAGARVIAQPWLGYRDQKQLALTSCAEQWVLMLDCDEELSPELREAIVRFFDISAETCSTIPSPRSPATWPKSIPSRPPSSRPRRRRVAIGLLRGTSSARSGVSSGPIS